MLCRFILKFVGMIVMFVEGDPEDCKADTEDKIKHTIVDTEIHRG